MNIYKVIGWTDWSSQEYPEHKVSIAVDLAVIECIRNNGYRFGGDSHQYREGCCPVLNDGTKACYSLRGWGSIMSSALNIDDSDGYAYMEWYMDSWTRTGLVGVDCPSRELVYPPKGVDKSRLNNVLCTKAVHEMHLADEPFDKIVSGKKTVEVRLNDEKRREISSGDIIIFYRKSHISDMCAVTVVDLRNYKNFSELFSNERLTDTGCMDMTVKQAAQSMYKYYSPEQEERNGVLAIEIKPIEG